MILKNNKLIPYIIGILLLVFSGYIISTDTLNINLKSATNKDIRLLTNASFYPLYFFASEVGGKLTTVNNLTPSGVEPHDFEPSAKDIVKIQEGKLLFVNGGGLEPWVEKLQNEATLNGTTVVVATDGLTLEKSSGIHSDEEDPDHEVDASVLDPHIWLSPSLAKAQVDKILQGFVKVDPDNVQEYTTNAQRLKQKLDELDTKFNEGLKSCSQRNFVTAHAAFGYLAKEYNLNQIPIAGISPDAEPSPAKMAEVTKFARNNKVKFIFFETLISPKLSETIANEVGAKTLVLDPIEGISDDDIKQGRNYFSVMESNLANLQTALECKR